MLRTAIVFLVLTQIGVLQNPKFSEHVEVEKLTKEELVTLKKAEDLRGQAEKLVKDVQAAHGATWSPGSYAVCVKPVVVEIHGEYALKTTLSKPCW